MKKIFLLFLTGTLLTSLYSGNAHAGDPKVKKQDPVVYFWYHFRTAVINNNLPKLQELTFFPFETTAPDGKVVKNSKGAFAKLYRPLLDIPGQDGKTMREQLSSKEDLTKDEHDAFMEGEFRFISFQFRMIKKKCFFVGADLSSGNSTLPKSATPAPVAVVPVAGTVEGAPTAPEPVTEGLVPPGTVEEKAIINEGPPPSKSPVATPVEPRQDSVFRFYWVDFRQAVLDNDVATIKSLTRFPFETKGPLEDDPKKKVVAKEFDLLWPRLLETDPHSWGPLRDSMKELIARREEPSVEEISTEPTGQVQVGVFVFRKIKNRWWLTRAIISE